MTSSTAGMPTVRSDRDRGSATVWMIGTTVAAFLLIGLVLDGGVMLRARSDAFSLASAAARAGAQELDPVAAVEGVALLDPVTAERAALDYLAARGASGTVRVSDDAVTVTVMTTASLQLLQVVGGNAVSFESTSTARAVKVAP